MRKFLYSELVKPIARRGGSMIAGALVAIGLATETAQSVEVAVTAVLLLSFDLVLSNMGRK